MLPAISRKSVLILAPLLGGERFIRSATPVYGMLNREQDYAKDSHVGPDGDEPAGIFEVELRGTLCIWK